jgi:hypothetical protein
VGKVVSLATYTLNSAFAALKTDHTWQTADTEVHGWWITEAIQSGHKYRVGVTAVSRKVNFVDRQTFQVEPVWNRISD